MTMSPNHSPQSPGSAPSPQNDGASVAAPSNKDPPTLLTLPAELRNQIYTLVLYHSENGGSIAPLHPSWKTTKDSFRTIVHGVP